MSERTEPATAASQCHTHIQTQRERHTHRHIHKQTQTDRQWYARVETSLFHSTLPQMSARRHCRTLEPTRVLLLPAHTDTHTLTHCTSLVMLYIRDTDRDTETHTHTHSLTAPHSSCYTSETQTETHTDTRHCRTLEPTRVLLLPSHIFTALHLTRHAIHLLR